MPTRADGVLGHVSDMLADLSMQVLIGTLPIYKKTIAQSRNSFANAYKNFLVWDSCLLI